MHCALHIVTVCQLIRATLTLYISQVQDNTE
jgi:hypothetical protein